VLYDDLSVPACAEPNPGAPGESCPLWKGHVGPHGFENHAIVGPDGRGYPSDATPPVDLPDELAAVLATADAIGEIRAAAIPASTPRALGLLVDLGLISRLDDLRYVIRPVGRLALTAHTAAKEAARVKKLRQRYAAVAIELHAAATAIGNLDPDGLAEWVVELRIHTTGARPESDAVKAATVDAIAMALLGRAGAVVVPATGDGDWVYHRADSGTEPIKVEVFALIDAPQKVAERSELERLRFENAQLRARVSPRTGAAALTAECVSLPVPVQGVPTSSLSWPA
jgi:hypothetical protein